ncbi:unnamed protein product [Amoebophrya sp. A120]|nr:unnamed protein product [Amoebophrya sp. A120]|eukprot:GSA120T00018410001.1
MPSVRHNYVPIGSVDTELEDLTRTTPATSSASFAGKRIPNPLDLEEQRLHQNAASHGVLPNPSTIGAASANDSEAAQLLSALDDTERKHARKKWVKGLNWVWDKIHAAFWVFFTCAMIYWTNFFRVIWESPLVHRSYLLMGFSCLGFNMSLLFYLAIVCDFWWKMDSAAVEKHLPQAAPAMMVAAVLTFFLFLVALYPVFGFFLTVSLQFTFFMGFVNAGHFLPSGAIGSVCMFVIFFAAFATSIWIPHEGLAHYGRSAAALAARGEQLGTDTSVPAGLA